MSDIVCISPIDGHEVARRASATGAEIAGAVAAARQAQAAWRQVSLPERAKVVLQFLDHMRAMNGDVVPELSRQMGRPVRYGGEFRSLEERVRHMVDIAPTALASIVPGPKPGFKREIRRTPVGIILTIAPWNYPFLTAVNTIVPALMAGNAVLLKAATQTILTGERFQQAFDKAGLPNGLFRNLVLTHEDTAKLLTGRHVDHVAFTGSVAGGR
jgi:acyl-CoA reductase-like NAD-dependent aldehyde dehydrogenase